MINLNALIKQANKKKTFLLVLYDVLTAVSQILSKFIYIKVKLSHHPNDLRWMETLHLVKY